jgi:hypothetical protein
MFDNLRDQANSTPFYDDEAQFRDAEELRSTLRPRKTADGRFLGMTPAQRFFLAVLLLIALCMLGSMLLLLTGRISLF